MSYATLADLLARAGRDELVQIADRDADGEPDEDVVADALAHADNIVNGYVRTRYDLPFATAPDLVRTWAVSIARHVLHRWGPPDYVVSDYKDAIAGLKDAGAGRIALPSPEGSLPVAPSGGVLSAHPDQVFTVDRLRGW